MYVNFFYSNIHHKLEEGQVDMANSNLFFIKLTELIIERSEILVHFDQKIISLTLFVK
jgi:hypothetical protein